MSAIETANLIDFSMEDDSLAAQLNSPPLQNTTKSSPSNTAVMSKRTVLAEIPAMPPTMWLFTDASTRRESLDNNPFDRVEKLANRPNDPFENLESEVEKGKAMLTHREVELGNLLSISDDNLLNDDQPENIADQQHSSVETKNNTVSNVTTRSDSCFKCEFNGTNLLQIDSLTQVTLAKTPQSFVNAKSRADSASPSKIDVENSLKSKKAVEQRNRLLRLSLTNSAHSSPVRGNVPLENDENSPEYISFSKLLAAAESSIKISDDLMAEEPNWVDSDKDFEAELEMLNIPMLKKLPSPEADHSCTNINEQQQEVVGKSLANVEKQENLKLTDLDVLRSKLKAKQNENNNNQDISKIIDSLKSLMCNREVDTTIHQQASSLLDTLSTALDPKDKNKENANLQQSEVKQETLELPPQAIVRQGTFNIDLQENTQIDQEVALKTSYDEIPDAMIKSSATYDGETVAEKADFILPEVEPSLAQLSQMPPARHFDFNDIAEQIGKLLHQVNNNETSSEVSSSSSLNPTVILVMNTTPSMSMQQSSYNSSHLEISTFNDGSPDLTQSNNVAQRRRSQSLSIHDKIKVLHLPLKTLDSNSEIETNSPPSLDMETLEFKTPSSRLRRSSFSNAIHSVTSHSNNTQRRMSCASDGVTKSRHNSGLSTHHERQKYLKPHTAAAVVHPMPQLPDVNTKRRLRSNSAVSSILKSTGPMKATIPVKKVSPMMKNSPHTPEDVKCNKAKTAVLDVPTGFPNASSTPAADRGYYRQQSTVTSEPKPRLSYLPTTPTSKQGSTPLTANAGVKRRTLTEFTSKSPIKPRVSNAAMNSLKATTVTTTTIRGKQRSPIKKTVNSKGGPIAKNMACSTRTSTGGATGAHKSKENKKP